MNDCRLKAVAALAAVLLAVPAARAQSAQAGARPDDIEIPAPKPRVAAPGPAAEPETADEPRDDVYVPGRPETARRKADDRAARVRAASPARATEAQPLAAAPAPPAEPAAARPANAIVPAPRDGDAQLLAAWHERRHALEMHAYRNAGEIEQRMLALQHELGYENLFAFATALCHESLRLMRFDPAEALRRASVATALAPDLPFAWWTQARASWNEDLTQVDRTFTAIVGALRATVAEPRWRAAAIADGVSVGLLAAFVAGALTVLLLVARYGRYVLHDVRHLLPAGAAPWQAGLLGALLLPLPWVFGIGVFGLLAATVAVIWFHLGRGERVVCVAVLAVVGGAPWIAAEGARLSSFSGTAAETVYLVERGGAEGAAVGESLEALGERPNPSFQVLFALGRKARRAGDAPKAVALLRRAAEMRPDSPEALVELGNALFLLDDLEGAQDAYLRAVQRDAGRAAGFYNLARLHAHRGRGDISQEEASAEVGRAQEYVRRAIEVDPGLGKAASAEPDLRANLYLAPLPLSLAAMSELAAADARTGMIRDAIGGALMGDMPRAVWPLAGVGLGALLGLVALLSGRMLPASACVKCGRPVCKHCDNEVVGPGLCGQCIHVYRHAQDIDPKARVEKEEGIRRFQARRERTVKLSAFLVCGSGEILLGRAGRGALALFLVLALVLFALLPAGFMPVPAGRAPLVARAVPLLLLALIIHLLAVRRTFASLHRPLSR